MGLFPCACFGIGYVSCVRSVMTVSSEASQNVSIICSGWDSCWRSTLIGFNNIYAIGLTSILKSKIISGGNENTLNVYLTHYSHINVSIFCNSSDICNIYCDTHVSCKNIYLYCHEGAICNTICNTSIVTECADVIYINITTIATTSILSTFATATTHNINYNTTYLSINKSTTVDMSESDQQDINRSDFKIINDIAGYIGIGMICIFVVLGLLKFFHGRLFYKECDKADYVAIARYIQSSVDVWTDCLFIYVMYLENEWHYLYVSSIFVAVPSLFSVLLCIYWIYRLRTATMSVQQRITDYLDNYTPSLVFFTIFGTFGGAIGLIQSRLFLKSLFNFSLKKSENERLLVWKFINDTLLEVKFTTNPQLNIYTLSGPKCFSASLI